MTSYLPFLSAWTLLVGFLLSSISLTAALRLVQRGPISPPADKPRDEREQPLTTPAGTADMSELRKQLFQAGFRHRNAPRHLFYIRLVCAGLGLVVGVILIRSLPLLQNSGPLVPISILTSIFLLAYLLPTYVIDKRRAGYFRRIELALPDALDFMLVSVEAGQSTDLAVMRVADELAKIHPDLAARFAALTEALAAGADRHDAWMRMAQETDNDDLRQLASIIVQSTTMGTPIAQTLRVFAADLRDRRVRKVEERANVLPTKMTLGTMIFTIPPLLILLLAPAIYRIMQSF
jgi:tight adherence protein C